MRKLKCDYCERDFSETDKKMEKGKMLYFHAKCMRAVLHSPSIRDSIQILVK